VFNLYVFEKNRKGEDLKTYSGLPLWRRVEHLVLKSATGNKQLALV